MFDFCDCQNGKITIKFVNKYTLTGLCIRRHYRPVVDLDNELSSGHLLLTRDNINLLSDSDEEI